MRQRSTSRASWLALLAVVWWAPAARAQDGGAPRPLGSVRWLSDAGNCGGSLATSACRAVEVSCPGVSTLGATVKVTRPTLDGGSLDGGDAGPLYVDAGPPRGTLVTQAGGGGSGAWEAFGPGAISGVLQPALDRGWVVAQVLWGQGTNTNGMWGGSAGPYVDGGYLDGGPLDGGTSDGALVDGGWLDGGPLDGGVVDANFGGDGVPDTPPDRGCLGATLYTAIHDDPQLYTAIPGVTVYAGAGQSGGGAAMAYAAAWFGAGAIFDCLAISGGPPIGLIAQGCMGTLDPAWAAECATYTGTGTNVCGFNDSAVSAQFLDNIANDGRRHCAVKAKGGPIDWDSWSLIGSGALTAFPQTAITLLEGDSSNGEAEPLGRAWAARITALGALVPVVITPPGSACPHAVPSCAAGVSAINAALAACTPRH